MPLINGTKMACEPCIRGHRSTKCTHANERLMVPVRKPGRPLSNCPHLPSQDGKACGCGSASITAAIPRKQACRCGTSDVSAPVARLGGPDPQTDDPVEATSPTRPVHKVQKSISRPQSGRKQSTDPAGLLERMDPSSFNIVQNGQRPSSITEPVINGFTMSGPALPYGYPPNYTPIQAQYGPLSAHPLQPALNSDLNGYTNGLSLNGLPLMNEDPLTGLANGQHGLVNTRTSRAVSHALSTTNGDSDTASGGSDSTPMLSAQSSISSIASSDKDSPEAKPRSCCSTQVAPQVTKMEANTRTPLVIPQQMPPQIITQNGVTYVPAMYSQYVPQGPIYTYPATYGSFHNPLQPQIWRQNMQAYNAVTPPLTNSNRAPQFLTPLMPENGETVHNCNCGDTCQCIGCAAHPYNEATQNHVRAAWSEQHLQDDQNYGQSEPDVFGTPQAENRAPVSSSTAVTPSADTPTSTTSNHGDEQTLSAADFFFVNYPFDGGCGGDTQECPCGDDCQCLGCTIHSQPPENTGPHL